MVVTDSATPQQGACVLNVPRNFMSLLSWLLPTGGFDAISVYAIDSKIDPTPTPVTVVDSTPAPVAVVDATPAPVTIVDPVIPGAGFSLVGCAVDGVSARVRESSVRAC